ncbi:hypothetical protein PENSPDRAFT_12844 [Peniophora sp. CONT]|nr:hypothetical protein PENSPDRAFT_12844 [Peniophora sp. CONT]
MSQESQRTSSPDIRLVIKAEQGGKKDYREPRERFKEYADYLPADVRRRFAGNLGHSDFRSLDDLDDEDLEYVDPEGEMVKYKTEYDIAIQNSDGNEIGLLKLLLVDFTDADDVFDFWQCFDTQGSPELSEFAKLFEDDDGVADPTKPNSRDSPESGGPPLQPRVQSAGTRCWKPYELTATETMAYILKIEIKSDRRRKGIGAKVYAAVGALEQVRKAKYLFAKPGPLDRAPSLTSPESVDWVERGRGIRAFHRRVGFRRIGNTQFFALALDPAHPSLSIKPEDDAQYIPTGEVSEEQLRHLSYVFA